MRFLLLSLLLAASASAQAPDTLTVAPGDGTLVTDWLAPGTTSYTIRLVQPIQQDVGTAVETIAIDGGVVTRVTNVSVPMQGMLQTDTLVADAETLTPSTHVSEGGPSDASLEFMDEGIVGLLTPQDGEAKTVMVMTNGPVFDSAWMGEIAQSLPLEAGLVARVQAYATQSPDETFMAVLTVGAAGTTATPDGDRASVPVTVEMGPLTMTYAVDAETRALLSTQFSPQPGVVIEIAPAE
ncbi:hypothetical protein [Rubrivirga sp. IMCC43871]|uniref:hypothetical protein n=1 Tax=Rubrivirga sp. IMCC43871 TaxID=3391575 RepID=UPI00398FCA45